MVLFRVLGCPKGWESYGNNCYKFEENEMRFYEEADAECWVCPLILFLVTRELDAIHVDNKTKIKGSASEPDMCIN